MESLKQKVHQMLGYPIVSNSWIASLEGSYDDLSVLLREARWLGDIDALSSAEDLLDDLYRQQDDQVNPTAHQNYCRGRISQMLKDVHAEVQELERIEKIELSRDDLRILGELYECSPMGSIFMAERLKTSNYDRNFIMSKCHHLEGVGLVRNRIVPAAGFDHWFITDAGRQRYEKELASARA
jgi:hypothetical protein